MQLGCDENSGVVGKIDARNFKLGDAATLPTMIDKRDHTADRVLKMSETSLD